MYTSKLSIYNKYLYLSQKIVSGCWQRSSKHIQLKIIFFIYIAAISVKFFLTPLNI